jgi:arylformamidase
LARRRLLAAAGASLVGGAAAAAAHGGRVFLDYDQAALDDAYTQTVWAPNAARLIAGYATAGAAVRKAMPPSTERYGDGAAEVLDIFSPHGVRGAPVMIFVHGGAWQMLGKDDASAPAPTFVGAGAIYVAPNFDNIPATTLPGMADQLRRAVAWVVQHIARFGGDPGRIFLGGHSSGAHLCAVLLTTDWTAHGMHSPNIRGGACLSGMYELFPVMKSARGRYVHLTPDEIDQLSPLRHMDCLPCPVLVANGSKESPEFKRQGETFAQVLAGMGLLEARVTVQGLNHFELVNELDRPDTAISRAVLTMMKRA